MKSKHRGFTQQLVLYVFLTILVVSGLIFLSIFYFSRNFIEDNALQQAKVLSKSISRRIERKIHEVELIPRTAFNLLGEINERDESMLPSRLLSSYSYLDVCRIHYDSTTVEQRCCLEAYRDEHVIHQQAICCIRDTTGIIRRTPRNGFWRLKYFNPDSILICYSEPLISPGTSKVLKYLELEVRLDHFTDFLQDIKLFSSGYAFMTTHMGRLLAHPDSEIQALELLDNYIEKDRDNDWLLTDLVKKLKEGETGYNYLPKNGIKQYVYYTPEPLLNWRIGIICPYQEVSAPGDRFCLILLVLLILGFVVLFWCILRIIRSQMTPLREFTTNVRTIADNNWNTELSAVHSTAKELRELYDAFKYMQNSMVVYIDQLRRTTEENQRMITEIKLAKRIQNRFLPQPVTLSREVEVLGRLEQSKSVGGDLYEYFIIDNKLYFAVGDVSGNGIPAALYMASIIKLFRYVAGRQESSAQICDIINGNMCEYTEDDMYVTIFTGILDLKTGVVTFTNAGHPNPLLVDENGHVSAFSEDTDVPIGILEDYMYKESRITLAPGSKLLLFTDGITDAESKSAEFFGTPRLMDSVRQAGGKDAQSLVETVSAKVSEHMKGVEQFDDMTLLVIHYKTNMKEEAVS